MSSRAPARMPVAVYVLGLSVFALGTSEFMLSGLLQPVARDMGVSIPTAGLLVSAFAIGMVVGAPALAAATLRLPRRTTLMALLAAFGLGQVAGALAPSYGVLFASRVVSALACAGFWAVGAAVAVSLVPMNARARAMAVMVGGLSIANIAGVPAGALLGQHAGWRAAFWAVAGLSALGLAGVAALVPRTEVPRGADAPRLRNELKIYRDRQVWLALLTTALNGGAVFCLFSYLAPLLTDVAGLAESWVPTVLALFGVGALIGTAIGGRIADAHLFGTMYGGIAASAAVLALLALTAESPRGGRDPGAAAGGHRLLHRTRAQRPDVQRGERRADAGGCDHDRRLQHRQHGRPVAGRARDQRGLGLSGGGLDRCGDGHPRHRHDGARLPDPPGGERLTSDHGFGGRGPGPGVHPRHTVIRGVPCR